MVTPINPILIDFPEEFETERLILRTARPGNRVPGRFSSSVSECAKQIRTLYMTSNSFIKYRLPVLHLACLNQDLLSAFFTDSICS